MEAAAGCNKGRRRGTNEDNLYFDGMILEEEHEGLRHAQSRSFRRKEPFCLAVFDGMGGETCGETASYMAALAMQEYFDKEQCFLRDPRNLLEELCETMNKRVCRAFEEQENGRMGSTAVMLYFTSGEVYVCNLGDSRAFRLRDNEWMQLSEDHVERLPAGSSRKPGLTQFLGILPEELRLEPYIGKGEIHAGDWYLLCSDGLTDMLTNVEICAIIKEEKNVRTAADKLIEQANMHGGRDNITVILCHFPGMSVS